MSQRSNKEWERRKMYLVRNLFEDTPLLSPIQEEQEPLERNSSSAQGIGSPVSLPELVIEVERNEHDEPEEHYRQLEKKIMEVYRELFLNKATDNSDEEFPTEELNETGRAKSTGGSQNDEEQSTESGKATDTSGAGTEVSHESDRAKSTGGSQVTEEHSTESVEEEALNQEEESDSSGDAEITEVTLRTESVQEDVPTRSPNGTSPAYEIVLTQAEVHCSGAVESDDELASDAPVDVTEVIQESGHDTDVTTERVSRSKETLSKTVSDSVDSSLNKSKTMIRREASDKRHSSSDVNMEDVEITSDKEMAAGERSSASSDAVMDTDHLTEPDEELRENRTESKSRESVKSDRSCESLDEPETVRKRQSSNIMAEISHLSNNGINITADFSMEHIVITQDKVMEPAETSAYSGINLDMSQDNAREGTQDVTRRRRSLDVPAGNTSKRSKTASKSTQTRGDWSEHFRFLNELERNFFLCVPRVYRLCSCSNHMCR